jgi:predicted small lipoprotein YifL
MKNVLIAVVLASSLAGCAVGRHGQLYVPPVVVGAAIGAAAVMVYEQNVVYPYREEEYYWDPAYGVYFFVGNDRHRHYMPRGWRYHEHGVPGYRHR